MESDRSKHRNLRATKRGTDNKLTPLKRNEPRLEENRNSTKQNGITTTKQYETYDEKLISLDTNSPKSQTANNYTRNSKTTNGNAENDVLYESTGSLKLPPLTPDFEDLPLTNGVVYPSDLLASSSRLRQQEIEVLKRKEMILTKELRWCEELEDDLVQFGVFDEDEVAKIATPPHNSGKYREIYQLLLSKDKQSVLAGFADALDRSNSYLSDEIRVCLDGEMRTLYLEDHIKTDAGTIVHREFGHRKRLSETEKRILVYLISLQTQCNKDVWGSQIARYQARVDIHKAAGDIFEKEALEFNKEIVQYIDNNRYRLSLHIQRRLTNKETLLKASNKGKLPMAELDELIGEFTMVLGASLLASEALDDERAKVLKRVNLPVNNDIDLGNSLQEAIDNTVRDIVSAAEAEDELVKDIKKLEKDVVDTKIRSKKLEENKDKSIKILSMENERYDLKVRELENELYVLRAQLRPLSDELYNWKDRKEDLEKSTRLHSIYSRDLGVDKTKVDALMKTPTYVGEDTKFDFKEIEAVGKENGGNNTQKHKKSATPRIAINKGGSASSGVSTPRATTGKTRTVNAKTDGKANVKTNGSIKQTPRATAR